MFTGPYSQAARIYYDRGWEGVLPMPRGAQAKRYPPEGYTGKRGIFPPASQVDSWRRSRGDYNIAIRLPEGVIGIDVDAYEGKDGGQTLATLRQDLGPWLPDGVPTIRSTSRNDGISGVYLFRADLPDGLGWRGELGPGIEIVHFGLRYAMSSPSIHPATGARYKWLNPGGEVVKLPAPGDLPPLARRWVQFASRPLLAAVGPVDTSPRYDSGQDGTPYGLRALGNELDRLRRVWDEDTEAFNPELNRCAFAAGQLASGGELDADWARGAVESLLSELGAPVNQWKTLESGFESGLGQPRRAPEPPQQPSEPPPDEIADAPTAPRHSLAAGGLELEGTHLVLPEIKITDKKKRTAELVRTRWSDFNITALGRILDDEGTLQSYSVRLDRERDGASFETLLPTKVLARAQDLTRWLMAHEVAVYITEGSPAWNVRLQLYLADQRAPAARTVPHLGWDDEAQQFLTYEGAITADGLHPFATVRPDPELRKRAIRYRYGFEHSPEIARHVLREVLTFHDPTVTSVFGAWWAACLLKGQIMQAASMFPVMAIEATSESGKTNGFFPMMIALAGNKRGQSNDTAASFRDMVAGHRNGIAWQDDLDDPKRLFEVIRAATSEGVAGKKGEDNTSTVDARLVAPILVSGEGLGMDKQKALADRVISLPVPSPTKRRSLRDPNRAQWDDIVDLRHRYPDLTTLAGHLVAAALQHASLINELPSLRVGDGRFSDKIAVLRLGARVLAAMTGDEHHVAAVDDWAGTVNDIGQENALTLSLVPTYLTLVGAVGKPERRTFAPHHSVPTPVLIRPDKDGNPGVWVNTDLLAEWWDKHRNGKVEERTETAEALRQQTIQLGMKGVKAGVSGVDFYRTRVKAADAETRRAEMRTWQRLPADVAERLLAEFEEADPPEESPDVIRTARGWRLSPSASARVDESVARVNRSAN